MTYSHCSGRCCAGALLGVHPRVGDEEVDPPPLADDPLDERPDRRRVGHVGGQGQRHPAPAVDLIRDSADDIRDRARQQRPWPLSAASA
jgi:hypothetical protein